MSVAIIGNVVLAVLLSAGLLTILFGAVLTSHIDHRRFAIAARRQAIRERRRAAAAAPRPRAGWAARANPSFDAS